MSNGRRKIDQSRKYDRKHMKNERMRRHDLDLT